MPGVGFGIQRGGAAASKEVVEFHTGWEELKEC